jgi:hypothetical protein
VTFWKTFWTKHFNTSWNQYWWKWWTWEWLWFNGDQSWIWFKYDWRKRLTFPKTARIKKLKISNNQTIMPRIRRLDLYQSIQHHDTSEIKISTPSFPFFIVFGPF